MKAKQKLTGFQLPRWGVVALAALLAATIAGSGTGSVSASSPAQGGRDTGRAAAQDRSAQPDGGQVFEDVPNTNPFFSFINRIAQQGIASGYPCGGPGEPCLSGSRPYYRPANNVTRSQMAKFVDNGRTLPGIYINTSTSTVPLKSQTDAALGIGVWGQTNGTGSPRDPEHVNAGVFANATGAGGLTTGSVGLLAGSTQDNGAWIYSNSATSFGLYVLHNGADIERGSSGPSDALYVGGHVTITGGCTGCTLDEVMMNTGTTDLHPGDVVAMGATAPESTIVNDNPVAGVTTASEAYNTAVVGVVGLRYVPGDPSAAAGTSQRTGGRDDKATSIKPGEYMTVVTHGTYKMVKVDAGKGSIHAGDLLTTSAASGAAMKVTDKVSSIGAVLGKAMGNLDSGIGYIPVLVTLR